MAKNDYQNLLEQLEKQVEIVDEEYEDLVWLLEWRLMRDYDKDEDAQQLAFKARHILNFWNTRKNGIKDQLEIVSDEIDDQLTKQ